MDIINCIYLYIISAKITRFVSGQNDVRLKHICVTFKRISSFIDDDPTLTRPIVKCWIES